MTPLLTFARGRIAAVLVICLWLSSPWSVVQAQSFADSEFLRTLELGEMPAQPSAAPTPASRAPRLRLFRIAPGFLSDPLGLQDDDSNLPGVPGTSAAPTPAQPDDGPDWLQLGLGVDNPYLDLRRPGDPGGVGFYRVNTQVQLLDSSTTACTLGFQAVTPAGIQFAGAPDGATVVSPTISVFHALSEGTALQGFVAKNVAVSNADGSRPLQRNLQYGMAVQRPIVADGPEGLRSLFLSVGALGQVRPERDSLRLMPTCDVLPGLHWHVNDNWWVSSGVLVPVGPTRVAPHQFQLTCSFQF